jgi:hypothetical protein
MTSPDMPDSHAYDAILAGHLELKSLLVQIDGALSERSGTIAEVSDLIAQLGDRLVKHFAMEEHGGYFGDALMSSPQLVAKANRLLAQHPKMCGDANTLLLEIRRSPQTEAWWSNTRQLFIAFRDALLRHERSEDRLIQEAYGLDLGSSD